jgi:hypothetical protein
MVCKAAIVLQKQQKLPTQMLSLFLTEIDLIQVDFMSGAKLLIDLFDRFKTEIALSFSLPALRMVLLHYANYKITSTSLKVLSQVHICRRSPRAF